MASKLKFLTPDLDPSLSSDTQQGQFGPTRRVVPDLADQLDCAPPAPPDTPIGPEAHDRIRSEQQYDLALLRSLFHDLVSHRVGKTKPESTPEKSKTDVEAKPESKGGNKSGGAPPAARERFSCTEFNALVGSVLKIHEGLRELHGIKPPQPDPVKDDYEQLEKLSVEELFDLCRKEGISPPDTCPPAAGEPGAPVLRPA